MWALDADEWATRGEAWRAVRGSVVDDGLGGMYAVLSKKGRGTPLVCLGDLLVVVVSQPER